MAAFFYLRSSRSNDFGDLFFFFLNHCQSNIIKSLSTIVTIVVNYKRYEGVMEGIGLTAGLGSVNYCLTPINMLHCTYLYIVCIKLYLFFGSKICDNNIFS